MSLFMRRTVQETNPNVAILSLTPLSQMSSFDSGDLYEQIVLSEKTPFLIDSHNHRDVVQWHWPKNRLRAFGRAE
jgi:hypothetical protein